MHTEISVEIRSEAAMQAGVMQFACKEPPESLHSFEVLRNQKLLHTATIDRTQHGLLINLLTHFLPNGPAAYIFRIRDTAGAVVWEQSRNLLIRNTGPLATSVRAELHALHTEPLQSGACDSTLFPAVGLQSAPWFESPKAHAHIDRLLKKGRISDPEALLLRGFVDQGFIDLGPVVEPELVRRANLALDAAMHDRYQNFEPGSSQRLEQMHEKYPAIREIWLNPTVLRYLELIFAARPVPCQTLVYAYGSQQDLHQDTAHLTPYPAGYMCGVWVALEDVKHDSGELEIVPGSHRFDRIYRARVNCPVVQGSDWSRFGELVVGKWQQMVQDSGLATIKYRPRAGSVLIWHENLMHGGSPRIDQQTSRRSMVSHYFAEGSIAYYDSTGLPGHMALETALPRSITERMPILLRLLSVAIANRLRR